MPGPSRLWQARLIMTRRLLLRAIAAISAAGWVGGQALAADLLAGRAKAEAACQVCHGLDGMAVVPLAANLAGQQKDYIIAQLEAYRRVSGTMNR